MPMNATHLKFLFFIPLCLCFAASTAPAADSPAPMAPTPVVLELFTSQECTFCPQADVLMGQMSQQEGLIVLSCHVDYFSRTPQSLGQRFCTERQDTYNRQIGSGPRYTPQLIVNGALDVIGYDAGRVAKAVMKARETPIEKMTILPAMPNGFSIGLPDIQKGAYTISLLMVDRPREIVETQGAQSGRTQTYYNVVSGLKNLGAWDGVQKTLDLDLSFTPENQGFAVLVQDEKTGHIMAAGTFKR